METLVTEFLYCLDDLTGVPGIGGLGNFQMQIGTHKTVFLQDPLECGREIRVKHVDTGHIYGHRNRVIKLVLPFTDLPGGLFPYIQVEPLNQSVFLKERDEVARTDHAALRVKPAHQRFGSRKDGCVGPDIELGLIKNLELMLFDRRGKVLDQLLGINALLMQLAVVIADGLRETAAHGIGCNLCPVEAALDVDGLVDIGINAHTQTDTIARSFLIAGETDGGILQNLRIVLAMGTINHEGIGISAADDAAGITNHLPNLFPDATEDFVAIDFAVALVDHMEMVDIDDDGVCRQVFIAEVKLLRMIIEEFSVIQPCQFVAFCGLDGTAILLELNNTANSSQWNGHIRRIRLCQRVDGTQLKASGFRSRIRSGDNDRNVLQSLIGHDSFQNIEAGHHRHHQIQQNERERVAVCVHKVERFAVEKCLELRSLVASLFSFLNNSTFSTF